jgi:hypothetical protein
MQVAIWGGELDRIARGDLALPLAVGGDALKALRVVGRKLAVIPLYGQQIALRVDCNHRCGAAALYMVFLAATAVVENILRLILLRPGAVGACHLRARRKY